MTIEIDQRTLDRHRAALVELHKKDAQQAEKVAVATRKMNSSSAQAAKATSPGTVQSRLRDAERHARDLERAQDQRATIAKAISQKSSEIARAEQALANKRAQEAKKSIQRDKTLQQRQDARLRELERRSLPRSSPGGGPPEHASDKPYDVFISHAWEDKDGFVRELASKCSEAGIQIWYDEDALKWGQSLRQGIDAGLAKAHFGVVVLSESFFAKHWTNYELDGLLEKESSGEGAVLPIWHKVTKDEVAARSPSLANRLALNTAIVTVDEIVAELLTRVAELKGRNGMIDSGR